MNTRAKGNRAVAKCTKLLEDAGYIVANVERVGKFIKVKDMFGLFDGLALDTRQVIFFQVTCNVPHTHWKMSEFAQKYGDIVTIRQYVWMDHKGFVMFDYKKDGSKIKIVLY